MVWNASELTMFLETQVIVDLCDGRSAEGLVVFVRLGQVGFRATFRCLVIDSGLVPLNFRQGCQTACFKVFEPEKSQC